ncbi:MAG TPA: amidophosphoribosyltransferase, partial [Kiritimatiellae bacterium]|nr:amidophosphoribosyltransferase [Kiritimatiellia bacterium]
MVRPERVAASERPREACGVCGVIGMANAAAHVYRGLFALQHRGQEGAGIVASDGEEIRSIKGQGLLTTVFSGRDFVRELPGYLALGHVRYSTTGPSKPYNVQPLVVGCRDGIWVVAHNGNLTNAHLIRRQYQDRGAIFQTSTDSEVLLHIIADPEYRDRPYRVERALARLRGAFAFLLMTRETLMAARDPHGFRPLCIGKLWNGYIVASESCALEQVGAAYLREVEPGELVTIGDRGLASTRFVAEPQRVSQCIFEHVYFARPDSTIFGENVHQVRLRLGRRLAREHPVEAEVVVPVPDSGLSAALGYSQESGIPLDYGFIRNHYIGRTFIMPQAELRGGSVDMKLAVVDEVVRGKRG